MSEIHAPAELSGSSVQDAAARTKKQWEKPTVAQIKIAAVTESSTPGSTTESGFFNS